MEGELADVYSKRVGPMLEALDEELADKLDEATNATDPGARAKLVTEAKAAIARYQSFLAQDEGIAALTTIRSCRSPIQQTMTATLAALSARALSRNGPARGRMPFESCLMQSPIQRD